MLYKIFIGIPASKQLLFLLSKSKNWKIDLDTKSSLLAQHIIKQTAYLGFFLDTQYLSSLDLMKHVERITEEFNKYLFPTNIEAQNFDIVILSQLMV